MIILSLIYQLLVYLKRRLIYMLVQDELKIMCTGDLPLQVNYAVGRLVAVIVYCFSSDLNLLAITVYMEV